MSKFEAIAMASGALFCAGAVAQNCAWIQREPQTAPGVVEFQAMAYDSARGRCVFFDGNQTQEIKETWEWDGATWTLASNDGPESFGEHAMVYDSFRGVTVLFGGTTVDHGHALKLDTVWEWNGQVWQMPDQGVGPSPRTFLAMAYDSDRRVTVLFGGSGEGGELLGDTWEWDGKIWVWRNSPGPAPTAFHLMAYDDARHVTVFYGGNIPQTWEWNGDVWTLKSVQGPLAFAGMVYDSNRQVCVLLGQTQQTWQWDGEAWMELHTSLKPAPAPEMAAMAYDSGRHSVVYFAENRQTWEFVCQAPPCYPDLDGNGVLDLFDFLAFVNSFNAGDTGPADCDHNQSLDLFDFLCYTNAFNKGC